MMQEGVSLEGSFPLSWMKTAPLSSEALIQLSHDNVLIMRAMAALEESIEKSPDRAHENSRQLEVLENKLDLVFMMMSRLVSKSLSQPPTKAIQLYEDRLCWDEVDSHPPLLSEPLIISLYLDVRIPEALKLYVKMVEINPKGAGQHRCVAEIMVGCDDAQSTWLRRTIFRHHRRAIQAKKPV